jgi:hypothetical protein
LVFTQAVLLLQAFVALFATMAAFGLGRAGWVTAPVNVVVGGGAATIVLLAFASGVQGRPWGRIVGWIAQIPLLAAFVIDPAIAILGVVFLGLWIMGIRLGGRIDRERAQRDEAAAARDHVRDEAKEAGTP